MNLKRFLPIFGVLLFFFEILIYEICKRLYEFRRFLFTQLPLEVKRECQQTIGNCVGFTWIKPFTLTSLFLIKIVVFLLFLLILFRTKKIRYALPLVFVYSFIILLFHFDVFPGRLGDLFGWLELANLVGILAVGILIIISSLVSIIYYYRREKSKSK